MAAACKRVTAVMLLLAPSCQAKVQKMMGNTNKISFSLHSFFFIIK